MTQFANMQIINLKHLICSAKLELIVFKASHALRGGGGRCKEEEKKIIKLSDL